MKAEQKAALIFDFDGPICASVAYAYEAVCQIFEECDHTPPTFEELVKDFKPPYEGFYRRRGIKLPYREIKVLFDKWARYDEAYPHNDVIHNLAEFWSMGASMFILSSNSEVRIRRFCQAHCVDGFFRHFVCGVEFKAPALQALCAHYELAPNRTAYIGDFCCDVAAARSARVVSIGMTRGMNTKNLLIQSGADHCIDGLGELFALIAKFT